MRHLFAYLLFVGVPFAGLLGVLRLGNGIAAPMAVHGSYAVAGMADGRAPCYAYLLTGAESTFTVAQSGRQLTVTLGPAANVTLTGTISGADVTLDGVLAFGTTPDSVLCARGDTIRAVARAHRDERVKRLDATLFTTSCAECAPITFRASRPRGYPGRRRS